MPLLYEQFLLFGDSITQGSNVQERGWAFLPALEEAYQRRLDVVNRGFSGYNTTKAMQVLPHIIPEPSQAKLRFMTIFFGANDAAVPESDTKQHVPLEQYIRQLKFIFQHPKVVAQAPRIILITPPPICEHAQVEVDYNKGFPLRRRVEVTKAYAEAARRLGGEHGIPVLDLWNLCIEKTGWKEGEPLPGSTSLPRNKVLDELMYDGLHLAPPGYKIMFDGLMTLIAKEFPDQIPTKLAPVLPDWNSEQAWDEFSSQHGTLDSVRRAD